MKAIIRCGISCAEIANDPRGFACVLPANHDGPHEVVQGPLAAALRRSKPGPPAPLYPLATSV